ncbi:MAG: FkbM family methyltransferase [Acidilobus sp.]
MSPAEAKEKALMALSVRRLVERGWLTALLGYLAKREELSVRLRYIGDVRLRRTTFGALAITTYYASKCWPKLPEDLVKAGRLLKPQEGPLWLVTALSLASYACRLQASGNRVSIDVSPERVGLEVNGVFAVFSTHCMNIDDILETFVGGMYGVPEVLSGLRGRDVIDVGANVGDTALYFLLNGARKVIAVEPLPSVARCAEENVRLSSATDKVKVINAALSDEPVSVPCDYDVLSSRYFSTLSSSGPCKVPGVTLGDLLNMVDDPYLLKMDCEGCEAQVILGPERERLRAFEHIIFETHPQITGVSNEKLFASLKELGFECRLHVAGDPKLGINIYHCKSLGKEFSA